MSDVGSGPVNFDRRLRVSGVRSEDVNLCAGRRLEPQDGSTVMADLKEVKSFQLSTESKLICFRESNLVWTTLFVPLSLLTMTC
jgi:hypothetical protein